MTEEDEHASAATPADLLAGLVGGCLSGALAGVVLSLVFEFAYLGELDLSLFQPASVLSWLRAVAAWVVLLLVGELLARGRSRAARVAIGCAVGVAQALFSVASRLGSAWWSGLEPSKLEALWDYLQLNQRGVVFDLLSVSLPLTLLVVARSPLAPPRRVVQLGWSLAAPALALALVGLGPLWEIYPGQEDWWVFVAWSLNPLLFPGLTALGVDAALRLRRRPLTCRKREPGPENTTREAWQGFRGDTAPASRRDRETRIAKGGQGMDPREAQSGFESFLKERGKVAEDLKPEAGIELMLEFYRDQRFTGCDPAEKADALLFQWGIYDWGEGDRFELDVTRQVKIPPEDGEGDAAVWQLHLTFRRKPSAESRQAGSKTLRCFSPDEVSSFTTTLQASPGFSVAASRGRWQASLGFESAD